MQSISVMATASIVEQMRDDASQNPAVAEQEYAAVAAAHRAQIFRFLLSSTRDADLAETLTQDTLLKAYRNWGSFRGDSSALTWLMRIAINLQKDHWRNRRMQFWKQTQTQGVSVEEAAEWLPGGGSSPETQLLAKERVAQVWKVVEKLSERQRTVFLLRHVEELELSEIAKTTGLNEGTVKAHLSRAMAKVKAEFGGRQ